MPTYLYCLLPAPAAAPPEGLTGVDGEAVRAITAGAVAAWVGTIRVGAPPPRNATVALRHDRVVRAALERGDTPAPARAGQIFGSDAECLEDVSRREGELVRVLERLGGCVEMTVHVALPTGGHADRPHASELQPAAGAGRGRAYLEGVRERLKLERFVQAEAAIAREYVSTGVAGLVSAEAWSASRAAGSRLTVSHLVPRDDVERYRAALAAIRTIDVVQVVGPDPPYSFATLSNG